MDPIRQAAAWQADAEAYWAAARHLPETSPSLALPRLRLAGFAVEYRLRAYVCAVRAGIPEGGDLGRLLRLAMLCGLELNPSERATVERLSPLHQGETDIGAAPSMAAIGQLLEHVAAQAGTGSS